MSVPETRIASSAYAPSVTPMLRTVLLCDIVDSTAVIERLGDVRAVALLQRHDQLMRQNLALCHGQLIDKADGVLALFERPIQALDFALRYQRGLRELGQEEKLELKARIGIHVGDVMMWANDPKDVLAGAKAFEVASALRAGVVWQNTYNKFDPTAAFGGYKESGFGREGGPAGVLPYVRLT